MTVLPTTIPESFGGGFSGALDYLMKQKQEKEEREPPRDQEERKQGVERMPQRDAGRGERSRGRGEREHDDLHSTERQGKEA